MVATAETVSPKPAAGKMEVFSLVSVEGRGIPDAAATLSLPPEQVRQSRDQVLAWIATNKPLLSCVSRDDGLRIAEVVARERLEHLYSLAMQAWEKSQEEEVTTRQEGMLARTTRTIKSSNGKIAYLNVAAKIADMLLEIPIRYLPGWMEEGEEADAPVKFDLHAEEHRARKNRPRRQAAPVQPGGADAETACREVPTADAHPPVRACSRSAASPEADTTELLEGYDAMLGAVEASAESQEHFRQNLEARARLFSPVQSADEGEPEVDDADLEADAADLFTNAGPTSEMANQAAPRPSGRRPLSRKERKARQRLLNRRKKRAAAR